MDMAVLYNRGDALHHMNAAEGEQREQSVAHRRDRAIAERTQFAEVDFLQLAVYADLFAAMYRVNGARCRDECLRRNAPAVEACATHHIVAFHQQH